MWAEQNDLRREGFLKKLRLQSLSGVPFAKPVKSLCLVPAALELGELTANNSIVSDKLLNSWELHFLQF